MSPNMGCCMQRGPNPVAWRTPLQFLTGCGGLHRRDPMGGSANGIPLNSRTPDACGPVPSTMPLASVTRSAAKTPAAVEIAIISAIGLFIKPYYNAAWRRHSCRPRPDSSGRLPGVLPKLVPRSRDAADCSLRHGGRHQRMGSNTTKANCFESGDQEFTLMGHCPR